MNSLTPYISDKQSTYTAFKFNSLSNKKILLVDSDREFIQPIEALLTNEGFEVTICSDGVRALQEVNRIEYQLILI